MQKKVNFFERLGQLEILRSYCGMYNVDDRRGELFLLV